MADVDLNIYLHSEEATKKLREFNNELEKSRDEMKLTTEQQIGLEKKLIEYLDDVDKKRKEIGEYIKKQRTPEEFNKERESIDKAKQAYNELGTTWFDANEKLKEVRKGQAATGKSLAATGEVVKKSGGLWKVLGGILGKTTVIIGLATAAFKIIKSVITSNNALVEKLKIGFAQAGAVVKEFGRAILNSGGGLKNMVQNLKDAAAAAKEMKQAQFDLVALQNQNRLLTAQMSGDMLIWKKNMDDQSLSFEERQKSANKYYTEQYNALLRNNEEQQKAVEIARNQLVNDSALRLDQKENIIAQTKALIEQGVAIDKTNEVWRSLTPEALKAFTDAEAKFIESGNAFIVYQQDVNDFAANLNKERTDEEQKSYEKSLQQREEFQKGVDKLLEQYAQSQIDALTGLEQIEAQRIYNLQSVNEEQKRLEALGTLDASALGALNGLRDYYNNLALQQEAEFNRKMLEEQAKALEEQEKQFADAKGAAYEQQQAINDLEMELELQGLEIRGEATEKNRLEIEKRYTQRRLTALTAQIAGETDASKKLILEKQKEILEGVIQEIDKEAAAIDFNFWEAIGITDPDQQEAAKQNLEIAFGNIVGMLDSMFSQRVADAQRNRELIDDQIAYTTDALNAEVELMKAGYASNVDAKRAELEELNKARQKAIEEEEKAVKAQQALDTAMQVSSLITASAQILLKAFSSTKNPIAGTILAIASVASMWAVFAAAKAKAASAAKLAEGGVGTDTGIISGKSHAEGGEPFLKHVEVERGEMWGVLSKGATRKHGKQFAEIVTSFNKDNLSIDRANMPDNYINVDVNQTNERLDRVQGELIKMNKHFGRDIQVVDTPQSRIVRKGNKTRIIRKNV